MPPFGYFPQLYIHYTKPTLWLNCESRLSSGHHIAPSSNTAKKYLISQLSALTPLSKILRLQNMKGLRMVVFRRLEIIVR